MAPDAFPPTTHRFVDLPGLRMHLAEAGEGPLVVLLHGFPDFWYAWRRQIGPLAAAGHRVVAPDMRGYNLTDKPSGLSAYRLDALADDVAHLIEALGEREAVVVGHDWGGIVAWHTALRHPGRVSRLAILNAPPPLPLLERPVPPAQLLKSWYVYAFQVPGLPEAALSADHFAMLKRALVADAVAPAAFSSEDLSRYEAAWAQPGALTAMLSYYRALPLFSSWDSAVATGGDRRVLAPVLVVWGERDPHLDPALAAPAPRRVPAAQVVRLAQAGHWVHLDEPERVNGLLTDFLAGR